MFFWPCDIQFFLVSSFTGQKVKCESLQFGRVSPLSGGDQVQELFACAAWRRLWVPGSIPLVSKRLFRRRPERPLLRCFQAVGSSGRSNGGQSRCAQGDGGDGGDGNWVMFDQQWLGLSFTKQTSEVGFDLIFQFLESITQSTNLAIFAGYPTKKGSIH